MHLRAGSNFSLGLELINVPYTTHLIFQLLFLCIHISYQAFEALQVGDCLYFVIEIVFYSDVPLSQGYIGVRVEEDCYGAPIPGYRSSCHLGGNIDR